MAKLDTPATRAATARQWRQLAPRLDTTTVAANTPSSWQRLAIIVGTLAAGLLIGVWWGQPSEWGWNRPGVLTAKLDAGRFLHQLADRAEEFLRRPRGNAAELERQIRDFRRACDALQNAPLPQLADADRDWVKERCQRWAATFDGQLAALREGTRPWQDIRNEADATVKSLATALRDRLS